jgi:hypothetical protein
VFKLTKSAAGEASDGPCQVAVLTNSLSLFKAAASGSLGAGPHVQLSSYLYGTLPSSYEAIDSYENYGYAERESADLFAGSYSYD